MAKPQPLPYQRGSVFERLTMCSNALRATTTGNCYQAAYECAQAIAQAQAAGETALAGARVFLVHGSVVTRAQSLSGKRIDHAWVEIERPGKCVVFEFASNKEEAKEKIAWTSDLQAKEEKRYTPEEAKQEAYRVSPPHYGPWHREPRNPA